MTLRNRTLGVLFLTFAGLLAAVYIVSRLVLMDSFSKLERDHAVPNVQRVVNALSGQVSEIDAELQNWVKLVDMSNVESEIDDTFSRLLTDAFTNSQINFAIIVDLSGRVVFGKAVDVQRGEDTLFPESFQEHFAANDLLVSHPSPDSRISGFLSLPEGPMLVASRPVPNSATDSPVGGTMLFLRHLDDAQIENLGQSTRLSVSVQRAGDAAASQDFQEALSALGDEDQIVIRRLDDDRVSGFTALEDVYGNPSVLVRADMPSTIYSQGQSTLSYLLVAVVLVCASFGVVTLLGLERAVLSRVTAVGRGIDAIGRTRDISARLPIAGKDELSGLAENVNRMLDQLETAEDQVQVRNRSLRQLNRRLADSQESERRRIGRELHDEIGQQLTGVSFLLESNSGLSDKEINSNLEKARTRLQDLISRVSDLSLSLRPSHLDDLGLLPAVASLVRQFGPAVRVRFEHDELADRPSSEVETAAYRIVQEALTNVVRHATIHEAEVEVRRNRTALTVSVQDKGAGFDPSSLTDQSSLGITGMRERAESTGGQFILESSVGTGTRIHAELPFRSETDNGDGHVNNSR